jgi:hypothetical protein
MWHWERTSRPKLGIGFEGGHYSWTNFPQIKFFTSRIAPTGGTIIEVKSNLQLQLYIVCECKKNVVVVQREPKLQAKALETVVYFPFKLS